MSDDKPWELHIYGGTNIEETYDYFESREAAMEEAESRATDKAETWGENDGGDKILIDRNTGRQEDLVINKVSLA